MENPMQQNVYERIKNYLKKNAIQFKEIHHEPTRTSAESAKARGEDISIGGKSILLKIGDSFHLFVLSASRKLDSLKVKRYFKVKRLRFATQEELFELTGLVPGSVPPFGKPIMGHKLYVDESIVENDRIAFNAGTLTDSIVMDVEDYMKIATPIVFDFST
jgi:prolyl-tRNA editing enzyme YbaK/EbsC (Cys-tRNA(Pro) deacylase)